MAVSLSGIGIIVGALMADLAGFSGFFTIEFSVGSKTLNKKITKHEKNISITETKHLSFSRLFSKAIENDSISDMEFNSILRETEQYKSLRRQLRINAKSSPEVDVIRKQIKKYYRKKFESFVNVTK